MSTKSKAKRDAKAKLKKKNSRRPVQTLATKRPIMDSSKINQERNSYIRSWSISAAHFDEKGYYDWMAKQLSGYDKILEVGTGDGSATKNLLEKGHKVISVDENPKCLNIAEQNLRKAGYKVRRLNREVIHFGKGDYHIEYQAIDIDEANYDYDVLLINADIANDPHLYEFLAKESVDAIICWLIGTHGTRAFNQYVRNNGNPTTPAHYRILTQNRVYEVADEILSSGKILHIVDRGGLLTPEQRNALIQCHQDQASVTRLKVLADSIRSIEYSEPVEEDAMQMYFTNQATGELIESPNKYFHSIQSVMP